MNIFYSICVLLVIIETIDGKILRKPWAERARAERERMKPPGTGFKRTEKHPCPPQMFTCRNKECIARSYHCDGLKDCTDGSDEEDCKYRYKPKPPPMPPAEEDPRCYDGKYMCTNGQCVHPKAACDGVPNCIDGSDEEHCVDGKKTIPPNAKPVFPKPPKRVSPPYKKGLPKGYKCPRGLYMCANKECIPPAARCDGPSDCKDGSDEWDCEHDPMNFRKKWRIERSKEIDKHLAEKKENEKRQREVLAKKRHEKKAQEEAKKKEDLEEERKRILKRIEDAKLEKESVNKSVSVENRTKSDNGSGVEEEKNKQQTTSGAAPTEEVKEKDEQMKPEKQDMDLKEAVIGDGTDSKSGLVDGQTIPNTKDSGRSGSWPADEKDMNAQNGKSEKHSDTSEYDNTATDTAKDPHATESHSKEYKITTNIDDSQMNIKGKNKKSDTAGEAMEQERHDGRGRMEHENTMTKEENLSDKDRSREKLLSEKKEAGILPDKHTDKGHTDHKESKSDNKVSLPDKNSDNGFTDTKGTTLDNSGNGTSKNGHDNPRKIKREAESFEDKSRVPPSNKNDNSRDSEHDNKGKNKANTENKKQANTKHETGGFVPKGAMASEDKGNDQRTSNIEVTNSGRSGVQNTENKDKNPKTTGEYKETSGNEGVATPQDIHGNEKVTEDEKQSFSFKKDNTLKDKAGDPELPNYEKGKSYPNGVEPTVERNDNLAESKHTPNSDSKRKEPLHSRTDGKKYAKHKKRSVDLKKGKTSRAVDKGSANGQKGNHATKKEEILKSDNKRDSRQTTKTSSEKGDRGDKADNHGKKSSSTVYTSEKSSKVLNKTMIEQAKRTTPNEKVLEPVVVLDATRNETAVVIEDQRGKPPPKVQTGKVDKKPQNKTTKKVTEKTKPKKKTGRMDSLEEFMNLLPEHQRPKDPNDPFGVRDPLRPLKPKKKKPKQTKKDKKSKKGKKLKKKRKRGHPDFYGDKDPFDDKFRDPSEKHRKRRKRRQRSPYEDEEYYDDEFSDLDEEPKRKRKRHKRKSNKGKKKYHGDEYGDPDDEYMGYSRKTEL